MWMILLGVLASAIMGSGLVSRIEPRDQPKEQVTLPMSAVGGGVAPEQVALRPQSEFKFDNIVHQAYDYSCGSAALTTVLRYHLGYEVTEQQAMEGMLTYGESDKIVARRGFSLVESLVVVVLVGVLAMAAIPSISGQLQTRRTSCQCSGRKSRKAGTA